MYPSDLTDAQWAVLEPQLLATRRSRRGRPVSMGMRRVIAKGTEAEVSPPFLKPDQMLAPELT
jgi:transposase